MKRILLVLMACFPVIGLMAAEVEPLAGDTIITLERKRIEVKDNGDRMKGITGTDKAMNAVNT